MATDAHTLKRPELKLTSMIDVIFLLLVFFVVTASFSRDEGVISAKLPHIPRDINGYDREPLPLRITVASAGDHDCRLGVENVTQAPANFTELTYLLEQLQYDQGRNRHGAYKPDHQVEIDADDAVRWQHVVNAFNAAVKARYQNIRFADAR